MKISVVIPTRNEEGMIKEIIDGCRPYADELMVIDGHSTDKTREIAEAAGVKVILDNGVRAASSGLIRRLGKARR